MVESYERKDPVPYFYILHTFSEFAQSETECSPYWQGVSWSGAIASDQQLLKVSDLFCERKPLLVLPSIAVYFFGSTAGPSSFLKSPVLGCYT